MKHKFFLFFLVLFANLSLSAMELIPTQELLKSYLEQDSGLKKLALELEKVQLSNQETEINNGFDIRLATGDIKFAFGKDAFSVSFAPSVKMTIPQYSNMGIDVATKFDTSRENTFEEAGISFSADLISSNAQERNITLLKSQRKILEAERAIRTEALSKEKEFYSTLQKLMEKVKSIISKQQTYYDDKISFEKIKAAGYSKVSATYRRAEMQVLSDEHEIETLERDLFNSYQIFYADCGRQLEFENFTDYMSLIPTDIEKVEPLNIQNFLEDNYSEIEKKLWDNKMEALSRQAKKNYSLTGTTGYSYDNDANNLRLGLQGSYNGIELGISSKIPLASDKKSSVTLSAGFNPNTIKKNQISEEKALIDEENEKISIEVARANYKKAVQEKKLRLETIFWEQTKLERNFKMYESLEEEMLRYYKQGIVTESEYLSAKVNRQSSDVSIISNLIDLIVYNSEIKMMFIDDKQIDRTLNSSIEN